MKITEKVDDYLEQVAELVRHAMAGLGRDEVEGVCVASPGPLNLERGTISRTANLPYHEVPIVGALEDTLHRKVHLVNDANAAALGEWLRGAGRGRRNVFYLTISTGIGGGAVVDGRLLLGKEGNAAEVGHVTVDIDGKLTCGCGKKGHWEAYCSGTGMPRFARQLLEGLSEKERKQVSESWLAKNARRADSPAIFKAAREGDVFAKQVIAEVGRLNAIGVANVTDSFDPELVTIGGGVALNNPRMILPPIVAHLPEYAINTPPLVRLTPLRDDAGLLGALSVAFDPALIGEQAD
jgi:glucokinase